MFSSFALTLMLAMCAAVDEVGRVCGQEGIDAHFHKGGILGLARGEHQLPALHAAHAAWTRLGLGDRYQFLDEAQTRERVRVANARGDSSRPTAPACIPAGWCAAWRVPSSDEAAPSTSAPRSRRSPAVPMRDW